jgi:uncharacterized protein
MQSIVAQITCNMQVSFGVTIQTHRTVAPDSRRSPKYSGHISSARRTYPSPMPVATMIVELRIEHAHSLKDRRQVVRSLKEKLRHGFNISIAELDEALTWQSATLGIAAISASRDYLSGLMREVENAAVRIAEGLGADITVSWDFLESADGL